MTIRLEMERDPVLANMTRGELKPSLNGILWDLPDLTERVPRSLSLDTQEAYTKAADELTVILRLVDRARDHALELSVRPVEDEVGTDA